MRDRCWKGAAEVTAEGPTVVAAGVFALVGDKVMQGVSVSEVIVATL